MSKRVNILIISILSVLVGGCRSVGSSDSKVVDNDSAVANGQFLEKLQEDTFNFFWETTNPQNGLTPDRWPDTKFSSVAAVGFALSSYIVGVERGFISRSKAAKRTLRTMEFFWNAPQSKAPNATGYKGFYYHFLHMDSGERYKQVELSSIDTALLLAGVLSSQSYFTKANEREKRIRLLADSLYRRADWTWFYSEKHKPLLSMGWRPETGFIDAYWRGYNEAMILYLLALGSPTHPIDSSAWAKWTKTYKWRSFYNREYVNFAPLFGHQYSHIWVDFRGIQDAYMRKKGIDYFENSRRATYANRAYCIDNPKNWKGYGKKVWGLTASDGPNDTLVVRNGEEVHFHSYWARGAAYRDIRDDGTIVPTAVGGSVPFAPDITIPTLKYLYKRFGDRLYGKYGFRDAFNLSYTYGDHPNGWFDDDYLGIDQGPILLMIENYRSELIWEVMKKNPYIRKGLKRAGFKGGWLSRQ